MWSQIWELPFEHEAMYSSISFSTMPSPQPGLCSRNMPRTESTRFTKPGSHFARIVRYCCMKRKELWAPPDVIVGAATPSHTTGNWPLALGSIVLL